MTNKNKKSWTNRAKDKPWNPKPEKKIPFYGADRYAHDTVHNTSKWQTLRLNYITKNPLCVKCLERGDIKAGQVVDHIKAIKDGGESWDENNLQTLCKRCHRIKTQNEMNQRKKKKKGGRV